MNQESDCEWQVLQGKEAKDLHTFHFPSHKHNVENGYLWFIFTISNLMSWSSLLFSLEIKIMAIYVYITSLQKTSAKILVFYTWQPFRKTRFFLFLHWAVFIFCWVHSLYINIITLIYFLSKCQAHKMPAYSVCYTALILFNEEPPTDDQTQCHGCTSRRHFWKTIVQ